MAWDKKPISLKQYQEKAEQLTARIQSEVQPFADTSTKARDERKKKAKNDLLYFCKTYLPHHFEDDFEIGHEKMAKSTKVKNKVIAWLLFRGCGKSTFAEVGYGAQCVLFRKTRFLPIISDTDSQAVDLMLPLRIELQENPRIKADFGTMKGVQWAEDEFVTSNDVKVEAFSWRSFKRGRKHKQFRFNVAICDDWEDETTAKKAPNSKKRYESLLSNVVGAAANRKGQDFQVIICLNRIERTDLSHKLEANKEVLFVKQAAENSKGRAAHPKAFPKVVLNRFKDLDAVSYAKNFLLKIISKETDDFQEEWFVELDKPEEQYKFIVVSCDPSVGNTTGHDHKAVLVQAMTMDGRHIDTLDSWIKRSTIDSMCKKVIEFIVKYQPHSAVIEENGFQVLVKEKIKDRAEANNQTIVMSTVKGITNNVNKNIRILRPQTGIKEGYHRFVKKGDWDRLKNMYLNFDSSRTDNDDDGPDAMEMGVRELRRLNGEIGNVTVDYY